MRAKRFLGKFLVGRTLKTLDTDVSIYRYVQLCTHVCEYTPCFYTSPNTKTPGIGTGSRIAVIC